MNKQNINDNIANKNDNEEYRKCALVQNVHNNNNYEIMYSFENNDNDA